MGELLDSLLAEIKENDTDTQVKMLCDRIMKEEWEDELDVDEEDIIEGPNIFLCLPVPGKTKIQEGFLTLEREAPETYILGYWTRYKSKNEKENKAPYKRNNVSQVKDTRVKKILKIYAEKLKYLRGE